MRKHLADCLVRRVLSDGSYEVYRLRISDAYRPEYWLDLDLRPDATLTDLDSFLRGIWLECCGHLSEFSIGPQLDYDSPGPFTLGAVSEQPPLSELLSVGQKFGYTYDMGSSTELMLEVQALEMVGGREGAPLRLLARNLPPLLICSKCEAPARWVHSWEYDENTGGPLLYCGRHGKSTRDEQLPVVNSPRMGVCGYQGGNMDDWPKAPKPEGGSA